MLMFMPYKCLHVVSERGLERIIFHWMFRFLIVLRTLELFPTYFRAFDCDEQFRNSLLKFMDYGV